MKTFGEGIATLVVVGTKICSQTLRSVLTAEHAAALEQGSMSVRQRVGSFDGHGRRGLMTARAQQRVKSMGKGGRAGGLYG